MVTVPGHALSSGCHGFLYHATHSKLGLRLRPAFDFSIIFHTLAMNSERFSEDSLKKARMANRLVQEGSDARLEELFGEDPEEEALPDVNSWEEGAEEMAKIIGAEVGVGVSQRVFLATAE